MSRSDSQSVFNLNEKGLPKQYVENDFKDNGNGTVTDHATGLMWMKSVSSEKFRHKKTQMYIQELNREQFAGHNDWRLPTVSELMSLFKESEQSHGLYIDPIFEKPRSNIWSADIDEDSQESAWCVNFTRRPVNKHYRRINLNVLAVRTSRKIKTDAKEKAVSENKTGFSGVAKQKPSPPTVKPEHQGTYNLRSEPLTVPMTYRETKRVFNLDRKKGLTVYVQNQFKDNGDGTVTDHATGLMWQKSGSTRRESYKFAQFYVCELNRNQFAGYDNWRIPTIPELLSLLEPTERDDGLYIDPLFDETQTTCWSADPKERGSGKGHYCFLIKFDTTKQLNSWSNSSYIRAVRTSHKSDAEGQSGERANEKQLISVPEDHSFIRGVQPSQSISSEKLQKDIIKYNLRKKPIFQLSAAKPGQKEWRKIFRNVFNLDQNFYPKIYVNNDYKDNGDGTITDRATGLMWQQSGSSQYLPFSEAESYVHKLNRQQFAGYKDWRLPTIPELISLLEPNKQPNDRYLSPLFDPNQLWCHSPDTITANDKCYVDFYQGGVFVNSSFYGAVKGDYVRAVRSLQASSGDAESERRQTVGQASQVVDKIVVDKITDTAKPKKKKSLSSKTSRRNSPKPHLRAEPLEATCKGYKKVFNLDRKNRPQVYIENNYEDNRNGTVTDHATGLMWQQSGTSEFIRHKKAQTYIQALNEKKFAGYKNWRLPTIPELMSLIEPRKQANGLYIDPIFKDKQWWCWSADPVNRASGGAFIVDFDKGEIYLNYYLDTVNYIRAVRSVKGSDAESKSGENKAAAAKAKTQAFRPPPGYKPEYKLRRKPLAVSKSQAREVFNLDDQSRPKEHVKNDFKENGDGTVCDYATGLMWQQYQPCVSLGSTANSTKKMKAYVEAVNDNEFAGYNDWRLPTTPELISLIEPRKPFINPLFGDIHSCYSGDTNIDGRLGWIVTFRSGTVFNGEFRGGGGCMRLVRDF